MTRELYDDQRKVKETLENTLQGMQSAVRAAPQVGPRELACLKETFDGTIEKILESVNRDFGTPPRPAESICRRSAPSGQRVRR